MRLMLTGPFVRAYELVYDLETMDRLLHIEKLSLMRGAGFEDCRVDLSFNIYHF